MEHILDSYQDIPDQSLPFVHGQRATREPQTPLEAQIKEIVIDAYNSKCGTSKPIKEAFNNTHSMASMSQFFTADDQISDVPSLEIIPSFGSDVNRPMALRDPISIYPATNSNGTQLPPSMVYSPQDVITESKPSHVSLKSAYSIPQPPNEQASVHLHQRDSLDNSSISTTCVETPLSDAGSFFSSHQLEGPSTDTGKGYNVPFNRPTQMPTHIKAVKHAKSIEKASPKSPSLPIADLHVTDQPVFKSTPIKTATDTHVSSPSISRENEDVSEAHDAASVKLPGRAVRANVSTTHTEKPLHTQRLPAYTPPQSSAPLGDDISTLKAQVNKLMQEKANLEGQLESIVYECQSTLKDRAQLQAKLAKAEVELQTVQNTSLSSSLTNKHQAEGDGNDLHTEISRLEISLGKKRRELAGLKRDLEREKEKVEFLNHDLIEARRVNETKEQQLCQLQSDSDHLKQSLDEKVDSIQEYSGRVAALQAGLESAESSRSFLHKQLEEAIESKLKLQEELKAARASSIAHNVKTDQLLKENKLLQDQIDDLQDSILKDKAQLVTDLEAIEADVLTKENSYASMQADKEHLEQIIKLKSQQIDELNKQLANEEATSAGLTSQLDDAIRTEDLLKSQIKKLEKKNEVTNDELQKQKQHLLSKEKDLVEVKQAKQSLQQNLQQAEATLISKEGTLQGLKDTLEIMKHELEAVKDARKNAENELMEAQESLAQADVHADSSAATAKQLLSHNQQLKAKLQQNNNTIAELQLQLENKADELNEREALLHNLQSQSKELHHQFQSLQSQFSAIASENGVGSDKDKVVEDLLRAKDDLERSIADVNAMNAQLKQDLQDLEEENAHLKGQLESHVASTPDHEEFKRVLQEKTALAAKIQSECVVHQQELIKSQANVARLESLLREVKSNNKKREKKLQEDIVVGEERIQELQAALSDMEGHSTSVGCDHIEQQKEINSLKRKVESDSETIQSLEDYQRKLCAENIELQNRLDEEEKRVTEIERASSLVAQELKRNADIAEQKLKEQVHEVTMEMEKLKGRLAGINTTQMCMREHASSLETALAQKESQLSSMASESNALVAEKEHEISELKQHISNLQDNASYLKAELEKALTDALLEKQRAEDNERKATQQNSKLLDLEAIVNENAEVQTLKEQLSEYQQLKADLQTELRAMKQQLAIAKTSSESSSRELQEKASLIKILKQDLQLAQDRADHSENELSKLEEYIQMSNSKHNMEVQQLKLVIADLQKSSYTGSIAHDDQIDGSRNHSPLLGSNQSLHAAQLQELGSQLERARKEGIEAAERRSVGEISALRNQLGSKSKVLRNLQSCLGSLREDMTLMQQQMNHHSSSLNNSYKSAQHLENKIENLRRSNSSSSPYVASQ